MIKIILFTLIYCHVLIVYIYDTNLHGLNPDDPGIAFCDITNAWESIIMETWHNYKQFIDIDVKEIEIYIKSEQKLKILQKTFPSLTYNVQFINQEELTVCVRE